MRLSNLFNCLYFRHILGIYPFKLYKMMNQFEVIACLADKLPGIKPALKNSFDTLNVLKSIQCLVIYTKEKLIQHDMVAVKKCLAVAEYIYSRGNTQVKNAVENIFVYSVPTLLNIGSEEERKQLQSYMPLHLYTAYVQQVLKPAI